MPFAGHMSKETLNPVCILYAAHCNRFQSKATVYVCYLNWIIRSIRKKKKRILSVRMWQVFFLFSSSNSCVIVVVVHTVFQLRIAWAIKRTNENICVETGDDIDIRHSTSKREAGIIEFEIGPMFVCVCDLFLITYQIRIHKWIVLNREEGGDDNAREITVDYFLECYGYGLNRPHCFFCCCCYCIFQFSRFMCKCRDLA